MSDNFKIFIDVFFSISDNRERFYCVISSGNGALAKENFNMGYPNVNYILNYYLKYVLKGFLDKGDYAAVL